MTPLSRSLLCLLLAAAPLCAAEPNQTPTNTANTANTRWESLLAEVQKENVPQEWKTNPPDDATIEAWRAKEGPRLFKLAREANEFYTFFPKSDKASVARRLEIDLYRAADQLGHPGAAEKLDALWSARLKSPDLPAQERFEIRTIQTLRRATSSEELETSVRQLLREFPGHPQLYKILLQLAQSSEPEKARAIGAELTKDTVPQEVRQIAEVMLKRLDLAGKPFEFNATTTDGQKVSAESLKGKVVLLHFWASWCPACMAEMPHIKAIAEKFKDKEFALISVNLDDDEQAMKKAVARHQINWPQIFDGKGMEGEIATANFIKVIPAMQLVDRKGVVRYIDPRRDLEQRTESLLNEKE